MHRRAAAVLALVVVLALSGCSGGVPSSGETDRAADATLPLTAATGASLPRNREAATRAAVRAIATMPMPRGSARFGRSPVPELIQEHGGAAPADPRLEQRTWWTVPLDPQAFRSWLKRHHPRGMVLPGGVVDAGSSTSGSAEVAFTEYVGSSTAARTAITLLLDYLPCASGTAVRASTWVSARRPRPAKTVVGRVTSVDVAWAPTSILHPATVRHRHLDADLAGDRRAITRLARAVNALVGSPVPRPRGKCPLARSPGGDAVTFTTRDGDRSSTLTFAVDTRCFGQVVVTADGRRLRATLDPGGFEDVVRAVVCARS